MATKLGDAVVEISADNKKLDRGLNDARKRVFDFGDSIRGFMERIGHRLFDGLTNGLRSAVAVIGDSIQASSNLQESINKAGVVFGQSANDVVVWARTLDNSFGQSQQQALEAAGGFGNLFTAMGLARDEAANMSIDLVELASDLASFNNIDPALALEKLRAGLIGETEPLRSVGVLLNETVVAAKAMELGLAGTKKELTEQDKVMARYAIILDQTSNAQGDFSRTSNDTANSQRRLAAIFENLSARVGSSLRPAYTSIINTLIDIAQQVQPYAEQIVANIATGLASALRYILPALVSLRNIFVYWLSPGSPPRLLPELIEWGRSAAGEFIGGFAKADFSALDTLGKSIETVLRSFVGSGKLAETDLVSRVFGSRNAIAAAVAEFKQMGSVSQATLSNIVRLGGPAGQSIANLVTAYFKLRQASEASARAQEALNEVTERYDRILNPLRGQLDDVRKAQNALREQQRLIELQNVANNFESTAAEKAAAQLEIQQIAIQNQIDLEEERRDAALETAQTALDGANDEEAAAQDSLDVAQAVINQQVETNNLLAEEMRLQEQLAAARKAAADAALREAEAAANEQKQLAEKARREQEQLNAAILQYQLQLADTPGKIALMRAELAKQTNGSVDYYNILTQIASLEQQLANEREAAAKKAAAGPGGAIALPEAPPAEASSVIQEITSISTAADELKKALDETFATLRTITPEDSKNIKLVGDSFKGFLDSVVKLGTALGIFKDDTGQTLEEAGGYWATFGEVVAGETTTVEANARAAAAESAKGFDSLASTLRVFAAVARGDWDGFWKEFIYNTQLGMDTSDETIERNLTNVKLNIEFFIQTVKDAWSAFWRFMTNLGPSLAELSRALGKWLDDTYIEFKTWFSDSLRGFRTFFTDLGIAFSNAGRSATAGFFKGLRDGWVAIDTWFKEKLQAMRDLLPFSEPKDASSPLRGLAESGESMINMIQEGMERAGDKLGSNLGNLAPVAMGTASSTTNQLGGITINQVFQGAAAAPAVRQAAQHGIMDALRAAGVNA